MSWEFLSKTGCYIDRDRYIITRCPFCGDSKRKLVNYGHLHISKEVPFFICFRCNERGHLKKLLQRYIEKGICTVEEAKSVLASFDGSFKVKTKEYSAKLIYDKKNLDPMLNKDQLEYLKERIGKVIDYAAYKIVSPIYLCQRTNFLDIDNLILRRIRNNTQAVKYLCERYVAFISYWDGIITLRCIDDNVPDDYRYITIHTPSHDPYDFYLANEYIDEFNLYKTFDTFAISEGVFDVLNKRVSFNNDDTIAKIAMFGKSRLAKGLQLLHSLFIKPRRVLLYLDEDVRKNRFLVQSLKFAYSGVRVDMFYNAIGKDLGESNVKVRRLDI